MGKAPPRKCAVPGLHYNMGEGSYHAATGHLSYSGAKAMLDAPAIYKHAPRVEKSEWDFGHAAHKYVLGRGADVVVIDAPDWRTSAARDERDAARAKGNIPLLAADDAKARAMAARVHGNVLAARLLAEGDPEVTASAVCPETGAKLRGRFDWLGPGWIVDYKTTPAASTDAIARSVASYKYHMQAAAYMELALLCGRPVEGFVFIFQEKTHPHLVTLIDLPASALARGAELWKRAKETWVECVRLNSWPGYQPPNTITTVDIPKWAYYDNNTALETEL